MNRFQISSFDSIPAAFIISSPSDGYAKTLFGTSYNNFEISNVCLNGFSFTFQKIINVICFVFKFQIKWKSRLSVLCHQIADQSSNKLIVK